MGLVKASRFIRSIYPKHLEPKSPDITKLVLSMRLIHRAVREVLKAPEYLIRWLDCASGMSPYGCFLKYSTAKSISFPSLELRPT
jgi:hypothetical protein